MTGTSFLITLDVFAFVWGALWGSFLNVVIYRLPAGESLVSPPSHCPKCQHPLAWYDNVPIFGWLILRGRCRYCKTKISPRYPLVELLTAILSLAIWVHVAHGRLLLPVESVDPLIGVGMVFFLYFYFVAILIAIAFIDLDLAIIPHELTIAGVVLGVIAGFVMPADGPFIDLWPGVGWVDALLGLAVGAGSIWAIIKGYALVRGVEGMGWGDFMLMGMVGVWVGWRGVIFVLFAASVQGLIAALVHAGWLKARGKDREQSGFFIEDVEAIDGESAPYAGARPEAVAAEPAPPTDAEPAARAADPGAPERQGEEASEASAFGQMAVPFGPFIALSAIEFVLVGELVLPRLFG